MSKSTSRQHSSRNPSLSLRKAVGYARKLKNEEGANFAPVAVAKRHWGYTALSGPGNRALAAMIQYGLVDVQGKGTDRTIRTSKLALIILDSPEAEQQKSALQEAALRPTMYRNLRETHMEEMPSRATLRWELTGKGDTSEAQLTDKAVDRFLDLFLDTMEYSGLMNGMPETVGSDTEPEVDDPAEPAPQPSLFDNVIGKSSSVPLSDSHHVILPLLAGNGVQGALQVPMPLTRTQLDKIVSSIESAKQYLESLVVDSEDVNTE